MVTETRYIARAAVALFASGLVGAQDNPAERPVLKTASNHPVQYYVSLPEGWSSDKQWPILVSIDASYGDFHTHAERFARARKDSPFIVVVPFVVTSRSVPELKRSQKFHYSPEVWQRIEKVGPLAFATAGLDAILADIRKEYGGEEKPFLTGWGQGGGSITWSLAFMQPERWRAVALACPYFEDQKSIKPSARQERSDLPIKVFQGESDFLRDSAKLDEQWEKARQFAEAHGYKNVSRVLIPGKFHEPLADEVVDFFKSRLKK